MLVEQLLRSIEHPVEYPSYSAFSLPQKRGWNVDTVNDADDIFNDG